MLIRCLKNIKQILKRNYGYDTMSGSRDSALDSDLVLSQYLCDKGYEGYATNTMQTVTGEFHPEFMICNVDGMRPLGRITNDPRKIANILERGRIDDASRDLKVSRKGKQRTESPYAARARPMSFAPTNLFAYDSPPTSPSSSGIPKLSFGDMDDEDDDDNKENSPNRKGGLRKRKRRSYKKRKTRTNKRKRSTRKGTRRRRR